MTKALISIDYSYDFVADDGKLTAGKPAQAIEDRIAQVTQEAYDNGDYIFVAMDRHDEGDTFHPETKHLTVTPSPILGNQVHGTIKVCDCHQGFNTMLVTFLEEVLVKGKTSFIWLSLIPLRKNT